ncbi:histidine kinase [Streptomyces sp. NBC_00435]|uniref:sensor histidine kinase n=1 Tax=Streptomyces sp. NBC_00435 TaxID=2903649 RepID=UPI002E1E51CE
MHVNTYVEQPSTDTGQQRARDLAPRVATGITAIVLCGFFGIAATYLLAAHLTPITLISAILLLLATLSTQVLHSFARQKVLSFKPQRLTLIAQGCLTYGPFLFLGRAWLGMPGFLAASTLLLLPAALAWPLFAAEIVATDVIVSGFGVSTADIAYTTVATILTSLVVYGLSRLSELVKEVDDSRAELARLAIAQERLRFARDLHDLLGYSLSAITLKCELAYRLVPRQPDRAQEELTEILRTARQALADVRTVARGYRDMSLAVEASTAESMLSMLGVRTSVLLNCGELPTAADTVLATVLREGLTNMLRHSKAENVEITGDRLGAVVRLSITNDGVGRIGRIPATDATGSSGISNLTARVEEHGGRLSAEIREDGWFALTAEIMLPATEDTLQEQQGALA